MSEADASGREVLPKLAEIYKKLYLHPGMEDLESEYKKVALRGLEPASKDLSHFMGDDSDELSYEKTPAGKVLTVTLGRREDFEMFLTIMKNKCVAMVIPKTQGAAILDGVVNWNRIHAHKDEFMQAEKEKGVAYPDWNTEFKRFTAEGCNYKDAVIVLSRGPYSAVSAGDMGLKDEEWRRLSHIIRKYHECTHFLCRRLYPDRLDKIRDELIADAVGIYAAFGFYDAAIAERFLGISNGQYTGGRLEIYLDGLSDIHATAAKVHETLMDYENRIRDAGEIDPYDIPLYLLSHNSFEKGRSVHKNSLEKYTDLA